MRNRVKVRAQIGVDDFVFPLQERLLDGVNGLVRTAARPIPKAVLVKVSLEDRLEQKHQRRLHYPILHCRNGGFILPLSQQD